MGENQGMIWIILGVLVVAAAVIFLGGAMGGTMDDSAAATAAAGALSVEACNQLNTDGEYEGATFKPVQANGTDVATDKTNFDKCVAS